MKRAGWALLLAAAGAACGVKAPPRPPGGNDRAPPNDLFKPTREGGPVAPEPITVGPQVPPAPPAAADAPTTGPATAPSAPATPPTSQEPIR